MLWKETKVLIKFNFGGKYFRTYLEIKVQTKTAVTNWFRWV